jgi:hypothetical protein
MVLKCKIFLLLHTEICDLSIVLSLPESKKKCLSSVVDLQNISRNISAEFLNCLTYVKNVFNECLTQIFMPMKFRSPGRELLRVT